MGEKASPTHRGVLRRRLNRFAQLGLVTSWDYDEHRDAYTVILATGDVAHLPRQQMPAYLHGLAQGAHAGGEQ